MTEHRNAELVKKAYRAVSVGDMETFGSLMADDFVWHVPGTSALSGDYKGKEDVIGGLGTLAQVTGGTFRQEIHDVVANDEHAVALIELSWEKPTRFQGREVRVFHMRDGRVTEVWFHPEDPAGSDAALRG